MRYLTKLLVSKGVIYGFLYYKSEIQAQMLLESATFARGYL
ncbi:hypothetical protein T12_3873 [Trichinella patagoniensis]|uniref:Uncharacterized protein n=1 Tax=Trichinella patagoniensis TaxID=990121 RepID=A0A0V0Z015_9BILA|nr:hypothetical protein T12_3873 [Trichinella patagoniensis]